MKSVFADTGYLIAILDRYDQLHSRAMSVSRDLGGRKIITSEMVLVELLNYFASKGAELRKAVVSLVEQLRNGAGVKIVSQTEEQFESALSFYKERTDKNWSLTDCASILIMQKENIREILSYDKHFQQAGFATLLRD